MISWTRAGEARRWWWRSRLRRCLSRVNSTYRVEKEPKYCTHNAHCGLVNSAGSMTAGQSSGARITRTRKQKRRRGQTTKRDHSLPEQQREEEEEEAHRYRWSLGRSWAAIGGDVPYILGAPRLKTSGLALSPYLRRSAWDTGVRELTWVEDQRAPSKRRASIRGIGDGSTSFSSRTGPLQARARNRSLGSSKCLHSGSILPSSDNPGSTRWRIDRLEADTGLRRPVDDFGRDRKLRSRETHDYMGGKGRSKGSAHSTAWIRNGTHQHAQSQGGGWDHRSRR